MVRNFSPVNYGLPSLHGILDIYRPIGDIPLNYPVTQINIQDFNPKHSPIITESWVLDRFG